MQFTNFRIANRNYSLCIKKKNTSAGSLNPVLIQASPVGERKIVTRLSEICMFIFIADFTNCYSIFLCVYSIVFHFFQIDLFTHTRKFFLIFYSILTCIIIISCYIKNNRERATAKSRSKKNSKRYR